MQAERAASSLQGLGQVEFHNTTCGVAQGAPLAFWDLEILLFHGGLGLGGSLRNIQLSRELPVKV